MPIKYILDTREKGLQAIFTAKSVPFEVKQLDLGDILILYSKAGIPEESETKSDPMADKLLRVKPPSGKDEEKIKEEIHTIVIERKSFKDLKASMSDNRYHDQKSRYMQLPKGTCFYILENNDPEFEELGYKQYLGMYIHTIIRDKITVLLTSSMEETCEFIIKIAETLEQFGFDIKSGPTESTQIKKKKVTGAAVYHQQLCCFPGISAKKADLIVSAYPNMSALIDAVKNNTFKIKGVGPVLLQNIKNGLLIPVTSSSAKIVFE